nr:extensin family protein [Myxococcota bacterium]
APTCAGEPPPGATTAAAALRAIACDLAASGVLSTVITPAYSAGHRDHLHVDARPDDPRLFVR